MRILVDLQPAQRDLARANAGNFGLQVALHVLRTRGEHEVLLLASGLDPDTLDVLRELTSEPAGGDAIRLWNSLDCSEFTPGPANWRLACARLVKEAAAAGWRPDVFLVPVPAGAVDQSAMPVFPRGVPVLAIVEQQEATGAQDSRVPEGLAACGFAESAATPTLRHALKRIAPAELAVDARAGAGDAAGLWSAVAQLAGEDSGSAATASGRPKPTMAYVSPLPPERSGIADYSAMLLPALARYYDIDVVAPQDEVSDGWCAEHLNVISPQQFREQHAGYDRVLYHFGNSSFHQHMFDLLRDIPGVVVLHDVYLGDIQLLREHRDPDRNAWTRALYDGHGWGALRDRFDGTKLWQALGRYPANVDVVRQAQGLIVHSEHARHLAGAACEKGVPVGWAVIPLARAPRKPSSRRAARKHLGLPADAFVVCSVGILNRAKLHDRIVAAWRESALAADPKARLVFVGGSDDEAVRSALQEAIDAANLRDQVRITGWVDGTAYHDWLEAADACIQLRSQSHGETSAAVLDCMAHGRPTIVNANGSMAELPADTVSRLPDEFTNAQLVHALEALWRDRKAREELGERARRHLHEHHAPELCAARYAAAIEQFAARAPARLPAVARAIGAAAGPHASDHQLGELAQALARSVPVPCRNRQLLVDVSAIARTDLKTGIQRVVRALVWEFIQAPPPGYRIEPVFMSGEGTWHYRYARSWTARMLDLPEGWAADDPVDFAAGDVLLIADYTAHYAIQGERVGVFRDLRHLGVKVVATVYDLLPLRMPQMFPPGSRETHAAWFAAITRAADDLVCISRAVAGEVAEEVATLAPQRSKPLRIGWFHLGADLDGSIPSGGLPAGADEVLAQLAARPSFLMVGTVEPRKGHAQTLAGFERLWARGADVNLVVVGKRGWMVDEVCDRMRSHPEAGRHLFWIEGASDEYLMRLYEASRCLIAASEGEGFGLPLIEAAQHGLPIIARDIPVFREVAGDHASYFSGDAEAVAEAVEAWLERDRAGNAPQSRGIRWLTWRECSQHLLARLELA